MYLSIDNYTKIEKMFRVCLPNGAEYEALPQEKKDLIQSGAKALLDTYNGYLKSNEIAKINKRRYDKEKKK
jgi:hypothetical protein